MSAPRQCRSPQLRKSEIGARQNQTTFDFQIYIFWLLKSGL
ncbi:23454_t:CDS:2 [Gigaspora margarita]|uniref:23454_t:CDS:1 n=1 Tax=Gigaspora margarita TaxID=4874 RepID=A0ABN7UQQ7_GIGMA|nr:23454_t:CDS:2 [Gigaspora margarita]